MEVEFLKRWEEMVPYMEHAERDLTPTLELFVKQGRCVRNSGEMIIFKIVGFGYIDEIESNTGGEISHGGVNGGIGGKGLSLRCLSRRDVAGWERKKNFGSWGNHAVEAKKKFAVRRETSRDDVHRLRIRPGRCTPSANFRADDWIVFNNFRKILVEWLNIGEPQSSCEAMEEIMVAALIDVWGCCWSQTFHGVLISVVQEFFYSKNRLRNSTEVRRLMESFMSIKFEKIVI